MILCWSSVAKYGSSDTEFGCESSALDLESKYGKRNASNKGLFTPLSKWVKGLAHS